MIYLLSRVAIIISQYKIRPAVYCFGEQWNKLDVNVHTGLSPEIK